VSVYSVSGRLTNILTVPQRALIRARESPRARFDSQITSHPRTTSSYPPRKRATTLAADGSTPPQLGAADTVRVLWDVENILNQFSKMDRTIRTFYEQTSDYTGQSKQPPRMTHHFASPKNSPVGQPAYEFTSSADYVFFTLLSIINTHVYNDIFGPFHPAVTAQESDRYEEEYLKMIETCRWWPIAASSDV
jgi:hypothetical protein